MGIPIFLTMPTPIFFNQLFILTNLHQHAKNQTISRFCSRDVVDLKILQYDWPRAFRAISQELDFTQIQDFVSNIAKKKKLSLQTNQKTLMIKFSNKFRKLYFWGKHFILKNFSSVMHMHMYMHMGLYHNSKI